MPNNYHNIKSHSAILKLLFFILCCFIAFIILGCSLAQSVSKGDEWNLVWSDEFNGTGSPDPAKWESLNYNRRNNDSGPDGWWSSDDVYLDGNGHLVIRAPH